MKVLWPFVLLFKSFYVYSQNMMKKGLLLSKEMQKDHKLGLNIANLII